MDIISSLKSLVLGQFIWLLFNSFLDRARRVVKFNKVIKITRTTCSCKVSNNINIHTITRYR